MSLSQQQENLLLMAAKKKNGRISMQFAESMYSSSNSAKSAIQTLELYDYVERVAPGVWKIVKMPEDTMKKYKASSDDESNYEKEAVE